MFVLHLTSVLVSLLSFSTAAPTSHNCSQLTQPLAANELHQILGRWILIEGFSNNAIVDSVLKNLESQWIMLNTTVNNQTLLLDQANPVYQQHQTPVKDRCLRTAHNVTLTKGKALEVHLEVASTNYRFLHTCPDCLLMHMYTTENNYQAFFLYGRKMTLAASDLELFGKQAECLQFPQPPMFHYDTNKELCPL